MDATLVLIDSDSELVRARALIDRLMTSDDAADIARLQAQARLVAGYEETKWPRRAPSTSSPWLSVIAAIVVPFQPSSSP